MLHECNCHCQKKRISPLLLRLASNFKRVFLAFILILIVCSAVYAGSLFYPGLNDALAASGRTPCGIFTSLFVHGGIEHFGLNMISARSSSSVLSFWYLFPILECMKSSVVSAAGFDDCAGFHLVFFSMGTRHRNFNAPLPSFLN